MTRPDLLRNCRACGAAVAKNAYTCPSCGLRPWCAQTARGAKLSMWTYALFAVSIVCAFTIILSPLLILLWPAAAVCGYLAWREDRDRARAPGTD